MAFKGHFKWYLLLVGSFSIIQSEAEIYRFDFSENLEGWSSKRGKWQWANRTIIDHDIPPTYDDGFALMQANSESDELYTQKFSIPYGADFTLVFYMRSEYEGSNNLFIDVINESGDTLLYINLSPLSGPTNFEWLTETYYIPPSQEQVQMDIFCYNGNQAPTGEPLRGCAIDHIIFETLEPTTTITTTEEPTTEEPTTEEPTTEEPTTEEPTTEEPTTEEPTTEEPTTEAPTTEEPTTEEPTTKAPTTEEPTTEEPTTEAPTTEVSTTEEPTTKAPTTVEPTTAAATATTAAPETHHIYDFQTSSDGWSLGLMNGASWNRVFFDTTGKPVGTPPYGDYTLEVFPELVQTGKVIAQSPQFEVAESQVKVTAVFWINGDSDYPARLKLRKRCDFSTFDPAPVLDLSPFGDQENQHWITYSGYLANPTIGEQFTLTLEGSLGGNPNNSVAVHRIEVEGVFEVPVDSNDFFSFENGLFGWTPGSMNGGRWILANWNNINSSLNIPQPSNGENFLLIERYDIFSGIISLESPRIELPPGSTKQLQLKFWMRGSVTYPTALRFRVKGYGGSYDEMPFLNLERYGDTNNPQWTPLQKYYTIPTDSIDTYFQLVIEADVGGDMNNLVAVDDISII